MPEPAWIDQQNAELIATIRRHGWYIQLVGGGPCAAPRMRCIDGRRRPVRLRDRSVRLGSSGAADHGGRSQYRGKSAQRPGGRIRSGGSLIPNHIVEFDDWPHRITPEPLPNPGEIVLGANGFYQRPPEASVPVLPLTWDDSTSGSCGTKAILLRNCSLAPALSGPRSSPPWSAPSAVSCGGPKPRTTSAVWTCGYPSCSVPTAEETRGQTKAGARRVTCPRFSVRSAQLRRRRPRRRRRGTRWLTRRCIRSS